MWSLLSLSVDTSSDKLMGGLMRDSVCTCAHFHRDSLPSVSSSLLIGKSQGSHK